MPLVTRKRLAATLVLLSCAVFAWADFSSSKRSISVGAPSVVAVSLPNSIATPGVVLIPITVGDLTGSKVISYDLNVDYDPAVIQPAGGPTCAGNSCFMITGTLSNAMAITPNTAYAGHFILSGFQASSLAGSGALIFLKFNIVGTFGQLTALTFADFTDPGQGFHTAFTFNEGDPMVALTHGSLTVAGNTPTASPSPTATVTPTRTATTTPTASPSPVLVMLPNTTATQGNVVAVPVSVGSLTGLNVISYDFNVDYNPSILQPVGGPTCSGNACYTVTGTLSAAAAITPNTGNSGHFILSAFQASPMGGAGTLIFLNFNVVGSPGSTSPLTFADYTDPGPAFHTGFTFNEGDPIVDLGTNSGSVTVVPGNTPTRTSTPTPDATPVITRTASPTATVTLTATSTATATTTATHTATPTPTQTGTTPIHVSLPFVVALTYPVNVPITAGNTTGLGVISYDLQITFDPLVVQPASPPFDQAGTLSSGMAITANTANTGHLIISAHQATPLVDGGTLLNLKFNYFGFLGQQSPLIFEDYTDPGNTFHPGFVFNEGSPSVLLTNGGILSPGDTATNTVTPTPSATATPTPVGEPAITTEVHDAAHQPRTSFPSGSQIHDKATLTFPPTFNAQIPVGSVIGFLLYSDGTCTTPNGEPVETVPVTGAQTRSSAPVAVGASNIKVASVSSMSVGRTLIVDLSGPHAETVTITNVGTAGAGGTGISFTPAAAFPHVGNVVLTETGVAESSNTTPLTPGSYSYTTAFLSGDRAILGDAQGACEPFQVLAGTATSTATPTATATLTPTQTPTPFPEYDLTISQSAAPNPVNLTEFLTYTLTVTNSPAALGGSACPNVRFGFPTGVPFGFSQANGTNGYTGTADAGGVTFTGGCISSEGGIARTAILTVRILPDGFNAGVLTSLGSNVIVDPENNWPENDETNNTAQTIQTIYTTHDTTATATSTGTFTQTNTPTFTPTPTRTNTATFTPTPVPTTTPCYVPPSMNPDMPVAVLTPCPPPIQVSLPDLTIPPGSFNFAVPITAGDITERRVYSYDLQVTFNPAVVQPADPPFDQAGTISNEMTITPNAANAGHLIISAYTQFGPLVGSGTLLKLKFNIVGQPAQATTLAFENYTDPGGVQHPGFRWNEGEPPASTTNGSIFVFGDTPTPTVTNTRTPLTTPTEVGGTRTATATPTKTPTFTPTAMFSPTPTGTQCALPPINPDRPTVARTCGETPTATRTNSATPTLTPSLAPTCAPATFSNPAPIAINDNAAGSPYPSNITVAGLLSNVAKVTVDLTGVSHTYPDDVDILLVAPGGQNTLLMSDAGGSGDITNLNFTFDDAAAAALPDETQLIGGTFKPTNYDTTSDVFPAPAPAPGATVSLSVFNGTDPNGTWSLYVRDDTGSDFGSIGGGWTLHITTTVGTACVTPTPTATWTATSTPTPTFTPTASPTASATPTATVRPTDTPGGFPNAFFSYSSTYIEDESQVAAITITRAPNHNITSGVNFSTSNGTATGGAACTSGIDYISVTNQAVIFNPGEINKTVNITICADNVTESDETIDLSLTGQFLGSPSSAVFTINDTATQFRNAANIAINGGTSSGPYPSTITIAGAPSIISAMRITLYDYSCSFPDDTDFLLIGPTGQNMVLLADAGGSTLGGPVTLNIRDAAGAVVPDNGPLFTGDFEPTSYRSVANFPSPAPVGPYHEPGGTVGGTGTQTLVGNFGGTNPNGTWSLYIRNQTQTAGVVGNVAGGWGIDFLPVIAATASISGRITTAGGNGIRNATVTITGNSLPEPRVSTTGSFGYYTFDGLQTGETYVVTVNSRRYTFSTPSRVISLVDNVADADFIADPQE